MSFFQWIQTWFGKGTVHLPPAPTPVSTTGGTPSGVKPIDTWVCIEVMTLVNCYRRGSKLPVLAPSPALNVMAQSWATHLASTQTLNHDGFPARLWMVVGNAAGAENAEEGQTTPLDVVIAWLNSPLHAANLYGNYTYTGVGAAVGADGKTYWVMDFAKLA